MTLRAHIFFDRLRSECRRLMRLHGVTVQGLKTIVCDYEVRTYHDHLRGLHTANTARVLTDLHTRLEAMDRRRRPEAYRSVSVESVGVKRGTTNLVIHKPGKN